MTMNAPQSHLQMMGSLLNIVYSGTRGRWDSPHFLAVQSAPPAKTWPPPTRSSWKSMSPSHHHQNNIEQCPAGLLQSAQWQSRVEANHIQ